MERVFFLTLAFIFYGQAMANNGANGTSSDKSEFIKKETKIKNPFDLRDPFKPKILGGKKGGSAAYVGLRNNAFSNLPSIEDVPINQIKIIGIIVGAQRRAMATLKGTKGEETYILKEGMKLGQDNAELKAILPGGIVIVEKIRNIYDQDEYLETIIPVTR